MKCTTTYDRHGGTAIIYASPHCDPDAPSVASHYYAPRTYTLTYGAPLLHTTVAAHTIHCHGMDRTGPDQRSAGRGAGSHNAPRSACAAVAVARVLCTEVAVNVA